MEYGMGMVLLTTTVAAAAHITPTHGVILFVAGGDKKGR